MVLSMHHSMYRTRIADFKFMSCQISPHLRLSSFLPTMSTRSPARRSVDDMGSYPVILASRAERFGQFSSYVGLKVLPGQAPYPAIGWSKRGWWS